MGVALFILMVTVCDSGGDCYDEIYEYNLTQEQCQWLVEGYWDDEQTPWCQFDYFNTEY